MEEITDETIMLLVIGVFMVIGAIQTISSILDRGIFKDRRETLLKKSNAELRKMFGEPFKTGIQNGQPVWVYEYNSYDPVNNDKSKDLIIIFGPNGVVQSHQFMSSEPTPVN